MSTSQEILKYIKSYLKDVNRILFLLESKMPKSSPGKLWQSYIEDEGEYPDLEISSFKRHGTGILVKYKNRTVDFDFSDLNLYKMGINHSSEFVTIDTGFLVSYIESIGVENKELTYYAGLERNLKTLTEEGLLYYFQYRFYLPEDLEKLKL
ncbi:MAG: DUF6896 domain-containing protein [Cytophagaceae bacterium]